MPISSLSGQMGQMGQMGANAGGLASPLLASALDIYRDGILGTEALPTAVAQVLPADVMADDPERLAHLDPVWRSSTLVASLLDGLVVRQAPGHGRSAAQVFQLSRDAATDHGLARYYVPLAEITRPDNDQFAQMLAFVTGYAELRAERTPEILVQIDDLLSFYAAIDDLRAERSRWILELLTVGLRVTHIVCARVKHVLGCPRPATFSPLIQPMIDTPPHGTLPSGHATEAFMLAALLCHIEGVDPVEALCAHAPRFRLAARIAINRTVAGVHFPADSAAGCVLGLAIADHLAARATGSPASHRSFDGGLWIDRDFHLGEMETALSGEDTSGAVTVAAAGTATVVDPGMTWLWGRARADWSGRWD